MVRTPNNYFSLYAVNFETIQQGDAIIELESSKDWREGGKNCTLYPLAFRIDCTHTHRPYIFIFLVYRFSPYPTTCIIEWRFCCLTYLYHSRDVRWSVILFWGTWPKHRLTIQRVEPSLRTQEMKTITRQQRHLRKLAGTPVKQTTLWPWKMSIVVRLDCEKGC